MELLIAYEIGKYMTPANDNRQSILHDLFDADEQSIIRSMTASKGLHIQAMNSCRMVDMLVEYEDGRV